MALGYLLLAHRNPDQVEYLFRTLYRPQDVFVLHFDKRSPAAMHQLARRLRLEHTNVFVLQPQAIVWGGYAAADVQIEAMAVALRANKDWHHFFNLSGQDFPLKPIERLEEYLLTNPEYNYIPWFEPLANDLWRNARDRVQRVYLAREWLDRLLKVRGFGRRVKKAVGWQNRLPFVPLYRRRPPPFRYYGGSNYVALSRAAADYIVNDDRAKRIAHWLRHSLHPDEIFVQSMILNGPLAPTVQNYNLHEIDFPRDSPHPKTYSEADLDRLLASPKFFARKFDLARDPHLMEALREQLV